MSVLVKCFQALCSFHIAGQIYWHNVVYNILLLSFNIYETEVAQLCPTLCDSMDLSPPGFSVHGILQARVLEWVAISPGDLPNPGIKPESPALQADALPTEPPGKIGSGVIYFYS